MLGRLLLLLLLGVVTPVWAAAPVNDTFANRVTISGGRVSVSADSTLATLELGEPVNTNSEQKTLWWTWTAPASGWVRVSREANFALSIIFCQGDSLSSLTRTVTATANSVPPVNLPSAPWSVPSPGDLHVEAGEKYQVCVASSAGGPFRWNLDLSTLEVAVPQHNSIVREESPMVFRLTDPDMNVEGELKGARFTIATTNTSWIFSPSFRSADYRYAYNEAGITAVLSSNLPPNDYFIYADVTNQAGHHLTTTVNAFKVRPANDDFAFATEITSATFRTNFFLYNSTAEVGEPGLSNQVAAASVWWHWIAPQTSEVRLLTTEAVGIYTGSTLLSLQPVVAGRNEVVFSALAGTSYYIKTAPASVEAFSSPPVSRQFELAVRPQNDYFSNRVALSGGSISVTGDTAFASSEPNQPAVTNAGSRTLWWTWTAPASGWVKTSVEAGFPNALVFWKGEAFSNLVQVARINQPATNYGPFGPIVIFPSPGLLPSMSPGDLHVLAGETYQICLVSSNSGSFRWNLDLSTLEVAYPAANSLLPAQTPLTLQLTPPNPNIEGQLKSIVFKVLVTNSPGTVLSTPFIWSVGSPGLVISNVLGNLPPGNYVVFAEVTNQAGRRLTTPLNQFKLKPANDDFASAFQITTLPLKTNYFLYNATQEIGETSLSNQVADGSVWWHWIAPESGDASVSTPEAIAVFAGSSFPELNLLLVGQDRAIFPVVAGTSYYIKVAPRFLSAVTGLPAARYFEFALRSRNDDFAGRQILSGASLTATADNTGATVEAGENQIIPFNNNTLWWSWTAPTNGLLNLHVFSFANNLKVAAWQGDTLTNLNLVASKAFELPLAPPWVLFPPPAPPEPLRFEVQAGQTYHISVGSFTTGPFSFSLDLCSIRVLTPKKDGVVKGPTNLLVQLSPPQLDIEGPLQALSVNALGTNPLTWSGQRGFYHVPASTAAPTAVTLTNWVPDDYLVYVDATNAAGRRILGPTNHFRVLPINDFFTNALPVTGFGVPQPYSFVFSTAELGEPVVAMQYDQRSLWWRWTAPSTGAVLVNAGEAGLGVFSGSRVSQLTALPSIYSDGVLRFQAQRGSVYYIKAVPTFFTWYGNLVITPAPVNDDFSHRIHVTGANFTLTVSNLTSSVEVGEPTHLAPGSLWWTWTAPSTGLLLISREPSQGFDYAKIEDFHGTALLELKPKQSVDELSVINGSAYAVVAGETLQLAIQAGSDTPFANLDFRFYPTPPKDQLTIIPLNDGWMTFSIVGRAGQQETIEMSTNLVDWVPLQSTTATNSGQVLFSPTRADRAHAFFRLRKD